MLQKMLKDTLTNLKNKNEKDLMFNKARNEAMYSWKLIFHSANCYQQIKKTFRYALLNSHLLVALLPKDPAWN